MLSTLYLLFIFRSQLKCHFFSQTSHFSYHHQSPFLIGLHHGYFFTLIYMSTWFISTCPTRHKFHQSRSHVRLCSLLSSQHLAQCRGENKPSLRSYWVSQVALVVKNLLVDVGDIRDASLIPRLGRSSGGEHGNPLQYSCLGNSMERGAWRATVHGVTKNQTRLSTHTHTKNY